MKKKWLSVLLGGVFLLSLSAAPSMGAPESSESLRAPKLKHGCWWHHHDPGFHMHCLIDWELLEKYDLSRREVSMMEKDAKQAVIRVVDRYTK